MSNNCIEQRGCPGGDMVGETGNIYCDKHFLSESAFLQIQQLEDEAALLRKRVAELKKQAAHYERLSDELRKTENILTADYKKLLEANHALVRTIEQIGGVVGLAQEDPTP